MDENWRMMAACLGMDPELFFPGKGEALTPAKAVCASCPVRTECLDWGMEEGFGIWGGTSDRDRRKMRKERGLRVRGPNIVVRGKMTAAFGQDSRASYVRQLRARRREASA